LDEIFREKTTSLTKFKLLQVCSIIHSKSIPAFEGSFKLHHHQIKEFLQKEFEGPLFDAIKTYQKDLMCEKKGRTMTSTPNHDSIRKTTFNSF
jgi:hypothetical protein